MALAIMTHAGVRGVSPDLSRLKERTVPEKTPLQVCGSPEGLLRDVWGRMWNANPGKGGVLIQTPQDTENQRAVPELYFGNSWLQVS